MYKVTKTFGDGDIQRSVGELVDGKGYKLLSKLISLRYLKEVKVKKDDATSFKCQLCSTPRYFIDEMTLDAHYLACHPDQVEYEEDKKDEDEDKDKYEEGSNSDGRNQ